MSKIEEEIINSLWVGEKLNPIAKITLASFIDNGYVFQLWVYDDFNDGIPKGTVLMNANDIISSEKIFKYKQGSKKGLGKGSVAGFADIFRLKLLYEVGGWWTDMDMTCLGNFSTKNPYYFRGHDYFLAVNNLIKCPKKDPFIKDCYESTLKSIDRDNTEWSKPSRILSEKIKQYNLESFIDFSISNFDRWEIIEVAKNSNLNLGGIKVFHWMNEEWRFKGWSQFDYVKDSFYSNLLHEYKLVNDDFSEITKKSIFYILLMKVRSWLLINIYGIKKKFFF